MNHSIARYSKKIPVKSFNDHLQYNLRTCEQTREKPSLGNSDGMTLRKESPTDRRASHNETGQPVHVRVRVHVRTPEETIA